MKKWPQLRRSERGTTAERAWETLGESLFGTLSMTLEDGYPYAVPLNFVCLDGKLYFHCATVGTKLDCIRRDPRVCVTAVADAQPIIERYTMAYTSVVAFGTAKIVQDEEERCRALVAICDRFAPGQDTDPERLQKSMGVTTIVRIDLENVQGKHNA